MEVNKIREIQKSARTLKNNITYESVKDFLEKYKNDLDLNPNKLDYLIYAILNKDLSNIRSITLPMLNLKFKKTSKDYWIIRGWDECNSIKKSKKCRIDAYSYPLRLKNKGYSESDIKDIVSNSYKKGHKTLKKRNDYDDIIKKRNRGLSADRYLNIINPDTGLLYTKEESYDRYIEDQKKAGSLSCKNRKTESYNTRIEFYIAKGLSIENAKKALFERQIKNGLNYYISKYGLKKGTEKYKIRIEKYGEKIKNLRKKYPNRWKISGKRYSDSSKRFFDSILSEIEHLQDFTIYYADNEYFIYDYNNKKIYFYDFYIKELNFIIEYHGLAWHPKTRIQEGWLHPYTKDTSDLCYDYDKYKENLAKNNNIDILTIFEDEIIYKKQDILNELRKRINTYSDNK